MTLADGGWWAGVAEKASDPWFVVGMAGQCVFAARFVVQWLATEREKKVVIPVAFWWISIVGATITLAYAAYRQDPVFLLAQAGGLAMYARNLVIHHRSLRTAA
ncbi:MAG TPA: lipid-A-disaccharide synthase N-terminal domain-containing protein [Planctomycetota bacterium]|nr:lipid-A-disaccharide synthase N-terminal domain-containing protein [Planctomycetota bacterium]